MRGAGSLQDFLNDTNANEPDSPRRRDGIHHRSTWIQVVPSHYHDATRERGPVASGLADAALSRVAMHAVFDRMKMIEGRGYGD